MKTELAIFDREISERGWILLERAIDTDAVASLRRDCLTWVDICTSHQIANDINTSGDGTAHHAIGRDDSIDAFVDRHLFHPYLSHYFADRPYILHACNPVGGNPNAVNYVHKIHRDVATYIPGFNFRMNMLVMLDDFTIENGATQVMTGSHRYAERPSDEAFEDASEYVTGPAGSVLLFNSYLWHRGTLNTTARNRVALTLSFGPAFIKPQMDYARLLGVARGTQMSPLTRQVLGYNSRVPTSHDEWYRPRSERLYQPDQG
ncbi:phytanoyl-CoA dioxygenase family protein [Burkholderia lata]|uniref:Dioxygenase n=1 Tax=Burkholderia lata (strain ATCC 17760 / DSM 23089 / LMG 22485 / NCIMB 9086 / R18194 / 383) TaxID=482957 RepID=A0A6P3AE63_BURL3|nr:phytanoyl-CoA dioxygenase family protein [Burkholderia lata]VWD45342.1 dioxygenase [Burkholderia lata]